MAFNGGPPNATLCVQGIKDGVKRCAIEAEFEEFGRISRVDITPGNMLRGVPDSRIAFVEFESRKDARKAMQALNGRYVQGKCVMIQFARSAPGIKPGLMRRGATEQIPQTPNHPMLAAKFGLPESQVYRRRSRSKASPRPRSRCRSHSSTRSRSRSRYRGRSRKGRRRLESRDRGRGGGSGGIDRDRGDRSIDRGTDRNNRGGDRDRDRYRDHDCRQAASRSSGDPGSSRVRHDHGKRSRTPDGRSAVARDGALINGGRTARDVARSPSRWRPSPGRSPRNSRDCSERARIN
eukprot:TRINITY_DN50563_c0_g1_i1.p1 TRINITY_DN50563_c0_g1~~TRINITY_DN50563_c0_g1_i1.p1  ORF type:complete len:293 (-),score=23.87 TRINITY_DN50563_c0_g1_i1:88-966(-)